LNAIVAPEPRIGGGVPMTEGEGDGGFSVERRMEGADGGDVDLCENDFLDALDEVLFGLGSEEIAVRVEEEIGKTKKMKTSSKATKKPPVTKRSTKAPRTDAVNIGDGGSNGIIKATKSRLKTTKRSLESL